nr:unnamed protein product [Callosobruchus chinensis]
MAGGVDVAAVGVAADILKATMTMQTTKPIRILSRYLAFAQPAPYPESVPLEPRRAIRLIGDPGFNLPPPAAFTPARRAVGDLSLFYRYSCFVLEWPALSLSGTCLGEEYQVSGDNPQISGNRRKFQMNHIPNEPEEWKKISMEFMNMWQYPLCLGAFYGSYITF